MQDELEKEICNYSFNLFKEHATDKYKAIKNLVVNTHKDNNFSFQNLLNLRTTHINYKPNFEFSEEVIFDLFSGNISNEDSLNIASDTIVTFLKDLKLNADLPNIYLSMIEKLKNEDDYNKIILREKIQDELSLILNKLLKMVFSCSKHYNKNNILNMKAILKELEQEKCLGNIFNIIIELNEELNPSNKLEEYFKARNAIENISIGSFQEFLESYINLDENRIKKYEQFSLTPLVFKIDLSKNSTHNLNDHYEERKKYFAEKEYNQLILKFFRR